MRCSRLPQCRQLPPYSPNPLHPIVCQTTELCFRWQGRCKRQPGSPPAARILNYDDKIKRQNFLPLALVGAIVFLWSLVVVGFSQAGYDGSFLHRREP